MAFSDWRRTLLAVAALLCFLAAFERGGQLAMPSAPPETLPTTAVTSASLPHEPEHRTMTTATNNKIVVATAASSVTEVEPTATGGPTMSPDKKPTKARVPTRAPNTVDRFFDFSVKAEWRKRLFTPTYMTKLRGLWFVVDCWHNRVIYSADIDAPIASWRDLVSHEASSAAAGGDTEALPHAMIHIPHSVATDGGDLLVLESSVGGSDGQRHSLVAYRLPPAGASRAELERQLPFVQEVVLCKRDAARRPHRVDFDPEANAFLVYLTNHAAVAKVRVLPGGRLDADTTCSALPFMKGVYARSFALQPYPPRRPSSSSPPDDDVLLLAEPGTGASRQPRPANVMYITAGPGVISVVNQSASPPRLLKQYGIRALGFIKGKMNDLQFIDGWWYATSTGPCAIVRFRDIETMQPLERLTGPLGLCKSPTADERRSGRCRSGTPYFLSQPDAVSKRIYVPYIFGCSGVLSFVIGREPGDLPRDIEHHWGGGWVETKEDLAVLRWW